MTTDSTTANTTVSPAALYLANLSEGSQGMRQPLDVVARIFDERHDAESYPWHRLTYRDSMAVRSALIQRYKASTVNKTLSAFRGVLKQAWRLGLMDADTYHRTAAVENVRASDELSGRALSVDEIAQLFKTCTADQSSRGARDAAMLAILYGCGLRRGELARLVVEDLDLEDGSILVRGKRKKQRLVYLTKGSRNHIEAWLQQRGTAPGPLFNPVRQTGEMPMTQMSGASVAYILRRRQEESGVEEFSPHDLRRTMVTLMLDAGVDVFTVQRLAGHADASTTAKYDRRGEKAKRQAVECLAMPLVAA